MAALAIAGLAVAGTAATSSADDSEYRHHGHSSCARQFDEAQRADMESFRDFDSDTFRSVHARDAVSIFPTGERIAGIDAIMEALESHFADRSAVWSWTELDRRVDGCRSAVITYEATYDIPAVGYHQRALTVVTYVRQHGRWLAVMDQGTLLDISD
jgi:hypothetical protein